MAYKILYVEDQSSESRENDLENLGYIVESYDPPKDLGEIIAKVRENIDALVLDYRLTKGKNSICFDAPTIAQTLRSKHSESKLELPIILMSNENEITNYYKDFTSQDLFDFVISKKNFSDNKQGFSQKLNSFIQTYEKIKSVSFDLSELLDIHSEDGISISPLLCSKFSAKKGDVFAYSNLIYRDLISSIGLLIGDDILSARLGISKDSKDWEKVLESLKECHYNGVFSDHASRWWMPKVDLWWKETIKSTKPLRYLDASERVEIIKESLSLDDIVPCNKTPLSNSSNFWTICQYSKQPIDPFDGIELIKDYSPWQEKEYLSFDSAIIVIDDYKDEISSIDKKVIREFAKKLNTNE
ncbi:MAG: hypothetical protein VB126_02420 [Paludibacter sp.]|nr:hypothetical protein [Paludibacter sp.]